MARGDGEDRGGIDIRSTMPPPSIIIESVSPELDGGRYPVKREVGDRLCVEADIFKEGHDAIAAVLRYRQLGSTYWLEEEMHQVDNDRWSASILLSANGRYEYAVQAFPDRFGTWHEEIVKKVAAGLDVTSELLEGRSIIAEAGCRARARDAEIIRAALRLIDAAPSPPVALDQAVTTELLGAMQRNRSRLGAATSEPVLTVIVDRVQARYAAWYAMFPRSSGRVTGRGATLREAEARLPEIAAMGFDVLYLLPIHPIGHAHRKGPNNTLVAGPEDPGVPYAIGNEHGGHDAIEPTLGTLEDFRHFVAAASHHGMEVALDLAIQASPDHPWVTEHPEWFSKRPDGSIKYAENPPKKYEDIYPINFDQSDWYGLWQEVKRIVLFWIAQGVTTFRVDNPHTKPTVFWEWLINGVQLTHPETIFLSEAFTRPKVMKSLAKAGFTQSYTYFTWRNFKRELVDYFTELTQTDVVEYLRGNLFANTHDILPYILQEGGRPAFQMRVFLAATLSSVYGIYSGFELCEATAVPGKEEYANSEKYEFKVWDWDRPGNIIEYVARLNLQRREHPALQEYDNLRFLDSSDDNVIAYMKATELNDDVVVAVVNLDPFQSHDTTVVIPTTVLGIASDEQYRATELLTGETFIWTGEDQQMRLDPQQQPAMLFQIKRWRHVDYAEPCY